MSSARGHILLVQEQRFRLETDAGRSFLLTLGEAASVEPTQLDRWREQHKQVAVEYVGSPGLASGIAHSVRAVG